MKTPNRILGLCLALFFSAAVGLAQMTTPPATPPVTPPAPHTPNAQASDTAKAVQALLMQFDAKRDQAIADRQALMERLRAATTDAEKQAILLQLRAEMQARKDEQTALGKQIRDELRKLREQRRGGG